MTWVFVQVYVPKTAYFRPDLIIFGQGGVGGIRTMGKTLEVISDQYGPEKRNIRLVDDYKLNNKEAK